MSDWAGRTATGCVPIAAAFARMVSGDRRREHDPAGRLGPIGPRTKRCRAGVLFCMAGSATRVRQRAHPIFRSGQTPSPLYDSPNISALSSNGMAPASNGEGLKTVEAIEPPGLEQDYANILGHRPCADPSAKCCRERT
jgi:hypothetical protein